MRINRISSNDYADQLFVQLKKGFLAYCVLKLCAKEERYTSNILESLKNHNLVVVEGTIYPLLNRLQMDGLLSCESKESTRGPFRKYYSTTDYGKAIALDIGDRIKFLNKIMEDI